MAEKFKVKGSGIFRKYFFVMFAVIIIVFTVLGGSMMVFVANYWKNENIDLLGENVNRIASTSQQYFQLDEESGYRSPKVMLTYSLSLVSSSINADIYICDLDGNVIVCKDTANLYGNGFSAEPQCKIHDGIKIPPKIINESSKGGYVHLGAVSDIYDEKHLVVGEPIIVDGNVIAVVIGAEPTVDRMYPFVASITKLFLFSAIVAFFVAAISIYIVTYSFTKPLRVMSKVTMSYSTGDFSQRLKVKGNDELAMLAASLNKMAQSLSVLEYSRRGFVANVSHELKTPMTTIGGFIDGILDGTITKDEEEKYLKIVSDEVKRLSKLVTSMLNISKIEAGELSLDRKKVDISSLVLNTMLTFEKAINDKKIEVTGFDVMGSCYVYGDEGLLHQVIYNLTDNAVKFTPENGVIDVKAIDSLNEVTVKIKNSGQGIPSDEIGRIFERFYKVDKSRSLDVKSTGLGLYIVKSIVEMHGGKVGVTSKEGEYTEFYFTLPKHTED